MRRLHYRVFNTETNEWLDIENTDIAFKQHPGKPGRWIAIHEDGTEARELHIFQYTGLHGDLGKHICEGDICRAFKKGSNLDGEYIVVWDKKRGRWAYKSGNHIEPYQVGKSGNSHCIVIGHSFDSQLSNISV